MQSVNKYGSKNRIGLGWAMGGAALAILAATIGLLLVRSNYQPATVAPAAPVSNAQPAPIAHERTLVDIKGSGQYPFGASGFDSLLLSKPVAQTEPVGSGHYPFGAHGFDSLLADDQ